MVGLVSGFSSSPSNLGPSLARQDTPASANQPQTPNAEQPVPNSTAQVNGTVNGQSAGGSRSNQNGGNGQRDSAAPENPTQQRAAAFRQASAESESSSPTELNEEDQQRVQELRARDIEVRAHEAAHLAAAGRFARGGAKFEFTRGPDGRSYAVGGSVSIDTGKEATPEATLQKADQIKRAALAPAEPSGQDRAVAASATALKLDAQKELAEQAQQESREAREAAQPSDGESAAPGQGATTTTSGTTSSEGSTGEADTVSVTSAGSSKLQSPASGFCAVCGGSHGTDGHLASNQAKADQFLTSAPVADPSRFSFSA